MSVDIAVPLILLFLVPIAITALRMVRTEHLPCWMLGISSGWAVIVVMLVWWPV